MMINFNAAITNLDGEELKMRLDADRVVPMTLGRIASEALLSEDRDANAQKKVERFALAVRCYEAKEPVELTPEQVSVIRERIGAVCTTMIVGRCFGMLDG
jgi:hypothetical protein